jgi:transposase InsO family protein
VVPDDEVPLTRRIVELASEYGRYGYRRVTALLQREGWHVNHKRVERIWRREGLRVPKKQPKRGRLWLNDGSCIRRRPQYRNHVWSYDFVADRTHSGQPIRMLTVIDEYTRELLGDRSTTLFGHFEQCVSPEAIRLTYRNAGQEPGIRPISRW